MDTTCFLFRYQRSIVLQNVSEVNRERFCLIVASSVYDTTKLNGLVTVAITSQKFKTGQVQYLDPHCRHEGLYLREYAVKLVKKQNREIYSFRPLI